MSSPSAPSSLRSPLERFTKDQIAVVKGPSPIYALIGIVAIPVIVGFVAYVALRIIGAILGSLVLVGGYTFRGHPVEGINRVKGIFEELKGENATGLDSLNPFRPLINF